MSLEKIIISAMDEERGIGKDGDIPWHHSEDLAHFRDRTIGSPVIMGRKTYLSLPEDYRPLPGRQNIVLTRSDPELDESVRLANTLDEAYTIAEKLDDKVFIAGGASIYRQTLDDADRLVLTYIPGKHDCDTFFPEIGDNWIESESHEREEITIKEYIPEE